MIRTKQIVMTSARKFSVEEAGVPRLREGEALVKIKKVGVCGSDIHLYRHDPVGEDSGPLVMGHECMGEVVEVEGSLAKNLVGHRVAIEPSISCGRCEWCFEGHTNLCPHVEFLGIPPTVGGLQDYIVHPVYLLEPLPDTISDGVGVVLEPLAIALHAIRLMKVQPGQTIVILGTGVLGTCVLQLLGLYQGVKVICVDLIQERLERAGTLGVFSTIQGQPGQPEEVVQQVLEKTNQRGADVVFECSGSDETMWEMCEVSKVGGHIAIIGTNPHERISFSSSSSRRKGLTLRFVRRSVNTLSTCLRWVNEGVISPEPLITHTFPASRVSEAFETVDQYQDGVLKALVDMEQWDERVC